MTIGLWNNFSLQEVLEGDPEASEEQVAIWRRKRSKAGVLFFGGAIYGGLDEPIKMDKWWVHRDFMVIYGDLVGFDGDLVVI